MKGRSVNEALERGDLRNGIPPDRGTIVDGRLGERARWRRIRQWNRLGDPGALLLPWINLNPAGNPVSEHQGVQPFKKAGTGWNMVVLSWRWGFDGCIAYNLFPYEDKDPKNIDNWLTPSTEEIVREANDCVADEILQFDAAVAAWGSHKNARRFAPALLKEIRSVSSDAARKLDLWCIRRNEDGGPKHPSRVGHDVNAKHYLSL